MFNVRVFRACVQLRLRPLIPYTLCKGPSKVTASPILPVMWRSLPLLKVSTHPLLIGHATALSWPYSILLLIILRRFSGHAPSLRDGLAEVVCPPPLRVICIKGLLPLVPLSHPLPLVFTRSGKVSFGLDSLPPSPPKLYIVHSRSFIFAIIHAQRFSFFLSPMRARPRCRHGWRRKSQVVRGFALGVRIRVRKVIFLRKVWLFWRARRTLFALSTLEFLYVVNTSEFYLGVWIKRILFFVWCI